MWSCHDCLQHLPARRVGETGNLHSGLGYDYWYWNCWLVARPGIVTPRRRRLEMSWNGYPEPGYWHLLSFVRGCLLAYRAWSWSRFERYSTGGSTSWNYCSRSSQMACSVTMTSWSSNWN